MKTTHRFGGAVMAVSLVVVTGLHAAESPAAAGEAVARAERPAGGDVVKKAEAEVAARYAKAQPEIQEYVLWTARSFGPGGLWLPEDAFAGLSGEAREQRVQYLVTLFREAEYGRLLCVRLAEASALKDRRLVPGLLKVAAYHVDGKDYDCRPKWMAVAALARQESDDAVPLLISLLDHGNQNTRHWARAALARHTGQDFKQDKRAWAGWWHQQGHPAVDEQYLKPTAGAANR